MNRKLMRLLIVALTVNLVVSKSVRSDDAKSADDAKPMMPDDADDEKMTSQQILYGQMEYIIRTLQEFEIYAKPQFQALAYNADHEAQEFFGWASGLFLQAVAEGKNGEEMGKQIISLEKKIVDAISNQLNADLEDPENKFTEILYEQVQNIKEILREFEKNAEPQFQALAHNALYDAEEFFGWALTKSDEAVDEGKNGEELAKQILSGEKEIVDFFKSNLDQIK